MSFARKFRRSKKIENVGDEYYGVSTDRDYNAISKTNADTKYIMFIGEKRAMVLPYNNKKKNEGYALIKRVDAKSNVDISYLMQDLVYKIGDFLDNNVSQVPEHLYAPLAYAYASCCMVPNAYPTAMNCDIVSVAFVKTGDTNSIWGYNSRWGVKMPKLPSFITGPELTLADAAIQSCSMAFDTFERNNKIVSKTSALYKAMIANGKILNDFFNKDYPIAIPQELYNK